MCTIFGHNLTKYEHLEWNLHHLSCIIELHIPCPQKRKPRFVQFCPFLEAFWTWVRHFSIYWVINYRGHVIQWYKSNSVDIQKYSYFAKFWQKIGANVSCHNSAILRPVKLTILWEIQVLMLIFHFGLYGPLLEGKWAWPPRSVLMV